MIGSRNLSIKKENKDLVGIELSRNSAIDFNKTILYTLIWYEKIVLLPSKIAYFIQTDKNTPTWLNSHRCITNVSSRKTTMEGEEFNLCCYPTWVNSRWNFSAWLKLRRLYNHPIVEVFSLICMEVSNFGWDKSNFHAMGLY